MKKIINHCLSWKCYLQIVFANQSFSTFATCMLKILYSCVLGSTKLPSIVTATTSVFNAWNVENKWYGMWFVVIEK